MAKDMLFATLDPTMRAVRLPTGKDVILSDTVGFISDLPTLLVAAFRATLEEVLEADLILHVRDIAHPSTEAQAAMWPACWLAWACQTTCRASTCGTRLTNLDPEARAQSTAGRARGRGVCSALP